MKKKIRVLVADDSALMRKELADILNDDPMIEVVAVVRNGLEAIKGVHDLNPDVVTLDLEMPEMDGLQTLGYIMSEIPTPCIVISAFAKPSSVETMIALEYGAVDFVTKPGGPISRNIKESGDEIVNKIKMAAQVSVSKLNLIWAKKIEKEKSAEKGKYKISKKIVTIISSTGGVRALAKILPKLDPNLKASVLVVQHMPEGFTEGMSNRLDWQSKIKIVEAKNDMRVDDSKVIIARAGFHMEIVKNSVGAPSVLLNKKPPVLGVRPCGDLLMESVAELFGKNSLGVVLTGMGSDGTKGSKAIKECNGNVVTEDESSCVIYGMPKSVFEAGLSDKQVPLDMISKEIEKFVNSTS